MSVLISPQGAARALALDQPVSGTPQSGQGAPASPSAASAHAEVFAAAIAEAVGTRSKPATDHEGTRIPVSPQGDEPLATEPPAGETTEQQASQPQPLQPQPLQPQPLQPEPSQPQPLQSQAANSAAPPPAWVGQQASALAGVVGTVPVPSAPVATEPVQEDVAPGTVGSEVAAVEIAAVEGVAAGSVAAGGVQGSVVVTPVAGVSDTPDVQARADYSTGPSIAGAASQPQSAAQDGQTAGSGRAGHTGRTVEILPATATLRDPQGDGGAAGPPPPRPDVHILPAPATVVPRPADVADPRLRQAAVLPGGLPSVAPGAATVIAPVAVPVAIPAPGATPAHQGPTAAVAENSLEQLAPSPPVVGPVPTAAGSVTASVAPATAPAASAPAPSFAAQVARPVFSLAAAGPGEHVMTINVTPDNLGPVTVRAHVTGEHIRVELFAPSDPGREALRAILHDLRRDLAGTGLGAQLDLSSQNQASDPGDRRHEPSPAAGRQLADSAPDSAPDAATGTPAAEPAHISASTIDVMA